MMSFSVSGEIRNRIVRPATAGEKQRHEEIRRAVEAELPELKQWARSVAARNKGEVALGTVFGAQELDVIRAIDDYAASHALGNRSAVVREALARLLGIPIAMR